MPCYRCGARQVDPVRGESPWKRGVRADRQVLICPACQSSADWTAEFDRCPVCLSAHLVRRLGDVECRDCGYVREDSGPASPDPVRGVAPGMTSGVAPSGESAPAGDLAAAGGAPRAEPDPDVGETPGLAEEVELALARVLGRGGRPARIG